MFFGSPLTVLFERMKGGILPSECDLSTVPTEEHILPFLESRFNSTADRLFLSTSQMDGSISNHGEEEEEAEELSHRNVAILGAATAAVEIWRNQMTTAVAYYVML
ncbi:hypothetical protein MRB53_023436 [Persea americana]|uniref:Uncharacterized protein n=1 Tax=Persea americana TaxID=3435 RepID=A0ACC2L9X8_PERAE|nr:hypothetical protein MRB53_023436 [Persea americana]